MSMSSSFLTDESNDSGLGDLPFPSLSHTKFSIFEDEDANDTSSMFEVHSRRNTTESSVGTIPELNKELSGEDDESNRPFTFNRPSAVRKNDNCLHQISSNKPMQRKIKFIDSNEPIAKKRKRFHSEFRINSSKSFSSDSLESGSDESQENIPLNRSAFDSFAASKGKQKSVLCGNYTNVSRNGQVRLEISNQPERQHRARYLTEGSRGAVKDQTGHGFPEVQLHGYSKKIMLQVFVGIDVGKVQPHLFYQASKVCGKNSTPCTETKIDGTVVLEIEMNPKTGMTTNCDCVGILKERNVDVEKRLAIFNGYSNKRKCTKCRLIFRVAIPNPNSPNGTEILQVASSPISCTQPPGIPEIAKKSLSECSVEGKSELFLIGKNFLKDTEVIFEDLNDATNTKDVMRWKVKVQPDKEYLQQNHLICEVPPYQNQTIQMPIKVNLLVVSGGKLSEPHIFTYKPLVKSGMTLDKLTSEVSVSEENSVLHQISPFGAISNNLSTPHLPSNITSEEIVDKSSLFKMPLPVQDLNPSMEGNLSKDHKPTTYGNIAIEDAQIAPSVFSSPVSSSLSAKQTCLEPNKVSSTLLVPNLTSQFPQSNVAVIQGNQMLKATTVPAFVLAGNSTFLIRPLELINGTVAGQPSSIVTRVMPENSNHVLLESKSGLVVKDVASPEKKNNSSPATTLVNLGSDPNLGRMKPANKEYIIGLPAEGFIDELYQPFENLKEGSTVNDVSTNESNNKDLKANLNKSKDYFNQHAGLMKEFSELPDSDLIQLINPSTFDNV